MTFYGICDTVSFIAADSRAPEFHIKGDAMMKGQFFKKTAAFILALCIVSGGLPQTRSGVSLKAPCVTADASEPGRVELNGSTLKLYGAITKEQIIKYEKNDKVKKVVAEAGTVLPENCSKLFLRWIGTFIFRF